MYNDRAHAISTEDHRTPRRRKSETSVPTSVYVDAYVQSLDMRIAAEEPETAYAEKKQSLCGLSDWLKIRPKESEANNRHSRQSPEAPGQSQTNARYGVRLANGRAPGV